MIERIQTIIDDVEDDELIDELSDAILHLEAAHDRWVTMEEEAEDEDEDEDEEQDPLVIEAERELIESILAGLES